MKETADDTQLKSTCFVSDCPVMQNPVNIGKNGGGIDGGMGQFQKSSQPLGLLPLLLLATALFAIASFRNMK